MINYRIRKRNTPIATLFKNYADKKSAIKNLVDTFDLELDGKPF
jgi:hypothetical protein